MICLVLQIEEIGALTRDTMEELGPLPDYCQTFLDKCDPRPFDNIRSSLRVS